MNNGRINIMGNNTGNIFNLYDKIPSQQKSTSYSNALTGTWNKNLLSNTFFSAENVRLLQNNIKAGVYKLSNNVYVIGDQNEDTLKIIMRSIFLQNAKHNNQSIPTQIAELNTLVTNYAVPQIYNEAVGYLKYKRDVSTLPTPLRRPTSTFHSNTLELKKFF